jgi:hypothetical protein
MKLFLVHRPTILASVSPYRLLDEQGQEIGWANAFLDGQHIRQLSLRSLRAYAYDLLHFARWWSEPALPLPLSEITESTLLDYVRHQLDQEPKPTPQTVNHRLTVIRCLYRFHHGQEISAGHSHFQRPYTTRCPVGYVERSEPIVLIGEAGTGKSHLATGLCNELVEAKQNNQVRRLMSRWQRYQLIALDEVGYVPLADIGAEFLFQVISERAERAAIIITTNLPFSEWTTVFRVLSASLRSCRQSPPGATV